MEYKKCIEDGCDYYATYEGEKEPKYCLNHKSIDGKLFKGYKNRICIAPDCKKRCSFNFKGQRNEILCKDHMEPTMVNVNVLMCFSCNNKPARYNTKENYKQGPKYCRNCRDKIPDASNMVDCIEKLCHYENCWKQATFGYKKTDKQIFCKQHKKEDMNDIKNTVRHCQFLDCKTQANYNFQGEKRAIYCKKHKETGMIDMYHEKCGFDGCNIRPQYNNPGEKKGLFCLEHKKKDMVDVLARRCEHDGCDKFAMYGYIEEQIPKFCGSHRKINTIDVRRITCNEEKCYTQATFGFLGKTISKCASHRLKGMVRHSRRRCVYCKEIALYGETPSLFPSFCEMHKSPDDINLLEQPCKSCGLKNLLNSDDECIYCQKKDVRSKKEEKMMLEWLKENNYNILSYDRMIDGGICIKNRPDFILESSNGGLVIVVEVDEFQHKKKSYTPECEITRMINISQALGQPTCFIRFNPDSYRRNNKQVKKSRSKERFKIFKNILDSYIQISFENIQKLGFCSHINLFYDEFDECDIQSICLLPFES